jgi:hypothetical protein
MIKHNTLYLNNTKERISHLSATLRYRVLSGDIFESPIFFLQLFLAVALDRRSRIPPLNHLSFLYTLTNHKGRYMSHVINMHRPGDPRQIIVSDLFKVILYLVGTYKKSLVNYTLYCISSVSSWKEKV